jgi:hypothetical protein
MTSPAEGDNAPVRQTSSRSMTGASPSIGSITAPVGGYSPSERRQRERLAVALIVEMPPAGNQAVLDIVGSHDVLHDRHHHQSPPARPANSSRTPTTPPNHHHPTRHPDRRHQPTQPTQGSPTKCPPCKGSGKSIPKAVQRTVPFGLFCHSILIVWYALHGAEREGLASLPTLRRQGQPCADRQADL